MRATPYTGPLKGVPDLHIHRLDPRARLPERANGFAVGLDVFAFLLTESGRATSRTVHQRGVTAVPTGIVVWASEGYYIQVCSRSSLAKKGVMVATAPGIIDPDYSGELIIMLYNGGFETHYVAHEHRIAQLLICPIPQCNIIAEAERPPAIGRGESGYGITGV